MTLLICYKNYYGAHVFFLPGAQSMLKPALIILDYHLYGLILCISLYINIYTLLIVCKYYMLKKL